MCAKSVLNLEEAYNADYKGEFAHVDGDFHLGLVCTCGCRILHKFMDLDAEFNNNMQNSALECRNLHYFA